MPLKRKPTPVHIMDRSQSKQLLLIADANPENVSVLKAILVPDYDISVAADAEETMRLASSPDAPALILLNHLLPAADLAKVSDKVDGVPAKCKATTDMLGCLFESMADPACLGDATQLTGEELVDQVFATDD